jgi:hypothetical protein
VVDILISKPKALSSNPKTIKKENILKATPVVVTSLTTRPVCPQKRGRKGKPPRHINFSV